MSVMAGTAMPRKPRGTKAMTKTRYGSGFGIERTATKTRGRRRIIGLPLGSEMAETACTKSINPALAM